jgi:solute:Na+ symporter, SSS family
MSYFEPGDWVVIFLYLLGIVALGLRFGKGQRNTRDYFLGSRNVPWWGVGFSIVASETSALTIVGVPAMAYGGDLSFIQIIIGYVLARIILAVVLVPHYFKGEIYSPYQLFGDAFGPPARRMAGGFFLISETLAAGVRVYVACIPIQLLLGVHVLAAILLFIGLSLLYTYVGGIKAVIWTDAVQFVLFTAGGLFTLGYIPHLIHGGFAAAFGEAAAAGKLHWLNPHFSWSMPFNLWMGLIGGTVQVMSSHGAEQLIVQRVLTCKDVADGRKALVLSAVIILPLFLVFLLAGSMLWVYYQHVPIAIPIPQIRPGIQGHDFIFPIFILTAVPSPMRGFLIVAILSAAMSSVSSALSALASVSTMDFFRAWARRPQSEEFYLRFSRHSTVIWAVALVVVGYLSRQVAFVLNAAFSLRGLTSGGLLGGLLLAVWARKGGAAPVVMGMAVSLMTMVAVDTLWKPEIGWPWYTLIGTLVTVATAWGVRAVWETGTSGQHPGSSGSEGS